MEVVADHTCWTCQSQRKGGHTTFLGKCARITKNNPNGDKQIPPEWVDKGCKHYAVRTKPEPEPMIEFGE